MPGKEVKAGTQTTLTCSVTNVPKQVTITWWDTNGQIEDNDGEYSAIGITWMMCSSHLFIAMNGPLFLGIAEAVLFHLFKYSPLFH